MDGVPRVPSRPFRRALILACLACLAAAAPAQAQFRGVSLAGRISYDVGGVFVSGTDSGIGGGVSLRLAFGDQRSVFEIGGELDVAGYVGEGDGDPIFTGAILASYRGFASGSGGGARGYWTVGTGIGGLAIAGGGLVIPFKVGAGLSLGHEGAAGLQIGIFDRYNLILKEGDPGRDFINNLGLEVALRLGR